MLGDGDQGGLAPLIGAPWAVVLVTNPRPDGLHQEAQGLASHGSVAFYPQDAMVAGVSIRATKSAGSAISPSAMTVLSKSSCS